MAPSSLCFRVTSFQPHRNLGGRHRNSSSFGDEETKAFRLSELDQIVSLARSLDSTSRSSAYLWNRAPDAALRSSYAHGSCRVIGGDYYLLISPKGNWIGFELHSGPRPRCQQQKMGLAAAFSPVPSLVGFQAAVPLTERFLPSPCPLTVSSLPSPTSPSTALSPGPIVSS